MTPGREASRGQLCNEGGMIWGTYLGRLARTQGPVCKNKVVLGPSIANFAFPPVTQVLSPTDCSTMRTPQGSNQKEAKNFPCAFPLSLPLKQSW